MVPIGSKMIPASTAAKTVQARVASARLGPRLSRRAAPRNEPGARPSGAASIAVDCRLGLIRGAFPQPAASIGRLRGPLPCDMVRLPARAGGLH